MRKEKSLMALLRGLVDLLDQEAARNPEFARELDRLLASVPEKTKFARKSASKSKVQHVPDVYTEWHSRGETEFRFWLRDQSIEVLRAVIREHELDAARRTAKWKDTEKLGAFIADQLRSRLTRGASFMRSSDD
jgi:hypothetical protein